MPTLAKKNIPFIFLAVICAFWAFFYQSLNILNEYGAEKPEWLLLIDGLIVLPILCFLCVKDKKEAAIKAAAYSCLIILLGSFILPESSKVAWPYLESLRYFAIAAFILLEIITIFTVFFAIKAYLTKEEDPDVAIPMIIGIYRINNTSYSSNYPIITRKIRTKTTRLFTLQMPSSISSYYHLPHI